MSTPVSIPWFPSALPMAEPKFFPDGMIRYPCPSGCGWFFDIHTPPMENLDEHLRGARNTVSDHYRACHGVED